jgi:hypothetical protein
MWLEMATTQMVTFEFRNEAREGAIWIGEERLSQNIVCKGARAGEEWTKGVNTYQNVTEFNN